MTVHPGYTDINLLFACTLRYVSHLPSSEGDSVRIRTVPQSDCELGNDGLSPPTIPGATRALVKSIDLDRPISTEVDISIAYRRSEKFIVLPTGDSHGLRIRVLRSAEPSGRVIVGTDTGGRSASYAVNLDSSRQPFTPEAIAAARQFAGVNVYVSQTDVGGEHWYRLRAGPFTAEADAKRSLLTLKARYPKAWLAIGDDTTLSSNDVQAPVTRAIVDNTQRNESLTQQQIDVIFKQAKTAFRKKDYATAIPLLTKLLTQPEFPQRAASQELLGLARERSGEVAHAKAEYEEYLHRYPNGPAARRVRERLHALDLAARRAVPGLSEGLGNGGPWKIYGGFAQLYRRDDTSFQANDTTTNVVSQNALLNDFAFVARRHGDRFDFNARIGVGYTKNFADNGLGDQTRVGAAVVELSDRQWGWRSRLGRQTVSGSGIYGTFDGLYVDYQLLSRMRVSLTTGSPVDTTTSSFNGDRRFVALASNFGQFADAWDFSTYVVLQQFQGQTDRRAFGTEIHYFVPGRTVIALVDYDFYYRELNNVLLIGTFDLPGRWTLNANVDRRKSPALSIRNALIGQQTDSLSVLTTQFTEQEIFQFAADRSADTDLYSLSASRPLGEHWQWTLDISRTTTGATPESGGVPPIDATPPELAYSTLLLGNSVFTGGDLEVIGLRYQDGAATKLASLGLSTRWPVWGALRIGPRVRVDRRQVLFNDSIQWLYVPSVRLDYQFKRVWLEAEGGMELGSNTVGTQSQKTTRTYFSLGYRINF